MPTLPPITAGSITGINGLKDRPVYFLKLNNAPTPNLVVKGDAPGKTDGAAADAAVSIKWGSKLMKNVNNASVNVKIMTPDEIAVFKAFATTQFPNTSTQFLALSETCTWVKMPFVDGLSDADFLTEDKQGPVINLIKRNIQKFSDDAVWTDLGKVVAVDIFNGNNDRFDIFTGKWMNYGNVMFLAAGPTAVIGLDAFDPNSGESNLNTGPAHDALNVLIDPGARQAFARACVTSVGATMKRELGGNKKVAPYHSITVRVYGTEAVSIDIATMEQLFLAFAPSFAQGITTGAADLKRYLVAKVQQYTQQNRALPQGVVDRLTWLNWMPAPDRPAGNAPRFTPSQMQAQSRYHGSRHRRLGDNG